MFHVMLVLPILIMAIVILAFLAFLLLLAVTAIIVAIIGGTSVAVLVKNTTAKKFLIMGFCIIFLAGASCLIPVLVGFAGLNSMAGLIIATLFGLIISGISVFGIINAQKLTVKAAKIALIVLFSVILAITLSVVGAVDFFWGIAALS